MRRGGVPAMENDFVQRVAEEYITRSEAWDWHVGVDSRDLTSWDTYAEEVGQRWLAVTPRLRINPTDTATHYSHIDDIATDVEELFCIYVWSGGRFAPGHPLCKAIDLGGHKAIRGDIEYLPAFIISRALHDVEVHGNLCLSFSFQDELRGALISQEKFSPNAKRAAWTDDVAMSCYREHFGAWPAVQYPIICEPDWDGLRRYLEDFKS